MAEGKRHKRQAPSQRAPDLSTAEHGLVVVNYGAMLDVEDAHGHVIRCVARQHVGGAVCGDRVMWQRGEHNDGMVVERLPRQTLLARCDARGQSRAIAANVDQLIVVMTAVTGPCLETDLLDRYLACAQLNGMKALLVINKIDSITPQDMEKLTAQMACYAQIGYGIFFVSAETHQGLASLSAQLAGLTSVFVGQSGVGKSSLIKHFLPSEDIRTAAVSVSTGHGKHTTTRTILYHLSNGGHLVDSPGVREFGLGKVSRADLARGFVEFEPFLGRCRFNDCEHQHEPDCALIEAAAKGIIEQKRFESFHAIANAMLE